jgi:arylsulfatase
VLFQSALAWIKKQHRENVPYFAYISLNAPHGPFDTGPFKRRARFLEAGYDAKNASRYGMIENIDDNFGLLWSKLNEWNALDNTIVIFMTDNGMSMPPLKQNGIELPQFNAGLKGRKNTPNEGGTHVPAFWYWKGVLGEGVDIPALTAHIDLYKTFTELAGASLPDQMQSLDGRSLLPLLEDPAADWPDRNLFIHCGRWESGKRDEAIYEDCAVRTTRWRFVNNKELYDISKDPGETTNVASSHPEVIAELRKSYDKWWESVLPLMVNEGLPEIAPKNASLAKQYYKQVDEQGIPEWAPGKL